MTTTRRVRQLRLTAPRDDLVRRGALMLEDALRTASFPDDTRVLLVRTLRVGVLQAGGSSASVARALERSVSDMASRAVHALDPSAASADVVYFNDAPESIAALATRIALQRSTSAWFWRLAVPAWRPSMSRDEALRALSFASLDTPAGAVGAAELVRSLHAASVLESLFSALRIEDVERLMVLSGWRAFDASAGASSRRAVSSGVAQSDRVARLLSPYAARWQGTDVRATWLACMLLVADQPVRAMQRDLPRVARDIMRSLEWASGERSASVPGEQVDETRGAPATIAVDSVSSATSASERDDRAVESQERSAGGASVNQPPTSEAAHPNLEAAFDVGVAVGCPAQNPEHESTATLGNESALNSHAASTTQPNPLGVQQRTPEATDPARDTTSKPVAKAAASTHLGHASRHGGLFLLLTVFRTLGIKSHIEEHPDLIECAFATRLLLYIAGRLGISDSDPAIAPLLMSLETAPGASQASRRELVTWTARARRWCAGEAGLTLRAIVHRPAHIAATRTHLDVHFDLAQLDMRIRRIGLDVDPGWIPWFGRVVKFHYGREAGEHGA